MARSLGAHHPLASGGRSRSVRLRALTLAVALAAGSGLVAVPSQAAGLTAAVAGPVAGALPGLATAVTAVPEPPPGLEAAAGDRAVGLAWDRSPSTGVSGYSIYRSTSKPVSVTGTPINATPVTGLTYMDSGRTNGTTYYYAVVAVDSAGGRSVASDTVEARPQAPAAPTGTPITWVQKASAAISRAEAGGVAHDGKLWVFGGQYTGSTQTLRSDVYDPAAGPDGTWTQIRDLPELITHAPVVADGNTLWIIGGYVGLTRKDSSPRVWKYDTVTNTYSQGPSLPAARGGGGAVIVGSQLHYFTGAVRMDSTGAPTTDYPDHWYLDLRGGTEWKASTPVPNPRNHVGTVLLGDKVYLIGGQHGELESHTPQTQVDAWDITTGTWSEVAPLPVARGHISASTFVWNGKILTVGGSVLGAAASRTIFEYDPATNAWTTRTNLTEGLRSPVADLIDGRIVLNGGRTSSGPTPKTWVGSAGTTVPDTTPPAAPQGLQGTPEAGPQVALRWTANGETDLAGYAVHRSTSTPVPTTGTPVSGAALLTTPSYTDTSVTAGTTYHYAVVAEDRAGNTSGASAPASVAVPTTPPPTGDKGSWTASTPFPVDIVDAGGAAIGTKVYVVGGKTSTGPVSTLRIYDTVSGAWTTGPALPIAGVENPAVVAHDGVLYAVGGSSQPFSGAVRAAHRFDPATGTWTRLADMGAARGGAAAVVVGQTLWVLGGMDGAGNSLTSTEKLDLATGTWSPGPALATARDNAGAAAVGQDIVVFGGRTRLVSATGAVTASDRASTERLTAGASGWTTVAGSMSVARRAMAVGTLDGRVVAAGGERQPTGATWPQTEEFDPATNTWRSLTDMTTPRHGAAAAVVDGRLHTVGGGTVGADSYSRVHEVFTPSGTGTPPPPDTTPPTAPAVSPVDGTYTSPQSVTMGSEDGAVIRYTVGTGSTVPPDPTESSERYTAAFTVSSSQVVKARAWDAAGNAGPVTQRVYTIQTATGGTRTETLTAVADTMARQGTATAPAGSLTPLKADSEEISGNAATRATSYLRFTVPALAAGESITGARLSLRVTNATTNGPQVWRTDPAWDEAALTWDAGQPARSGTAAVGNFGSMGLNTRVGTAVTGVTSAGDVSFQLHADVSDGVEFASRENATEANRPQLVLTIATGGTTQPDTTPPAAPAVSPASGTYAAAQSVTVTAEAGAVIRYTVGTGSTVPADPSESSAQYTGPIAVSSSQVVKARAWDAAGNAGPVTQRTYTIQAATGGTRTVTLTPNADTMAREAAATTAAGSLTSLKADSEETTGNIATRATPYLRFTVPALAAGESVTGARLSLRVSNATTNGPQVWLTSPVWNEATMTWSSGQPARSSVAAVGNFGSMSSSTRVGTAVTGVTGPGDVSFQLHAETSDGMEFASRENATPANHPQLVLTIATGGSTPADTTPPAPVQEPVTAVVDGSAIRVGWAGNTEADLAGYRLYRSTTTPVSTSGSSYPNGTLLAFAPGAAGSYTDTAVTPGTTYHYVVVAEDAAGNASQPSTAVSAAVPASTPTGFTAKVRFQDATSTPPSGYAADWGQAYGARSGATQGSGLTYGWVGVDTTTPLDLTKNGRVRTGTSTTDARRTGVVHMDWQAAAGTGGTASPGSWELAVPNGSYAVTVSVGDAGNFYDSRHQIAVEGVAAVTGFVPSSTSRFASAVRTVSVTDGRLTLSQAGGLNTKINYVDVVASTGTSEPEPDTTAPAAPVGVSTALGGEPSVTVGWSAGLEPGSDAPAPDLAGYRVYRSTSSSVAVTSGNLVSGPDLLAHPDTTSFTDKGVTPGTTYYYVVVAVDRTGNASRASAAADAVVPASSSTGFALKVRFQNALSTPPAGYVADWGQAFASRAGTNQGLGNSYGWVREGSSTALDLSANGRVRTGTTTTDARLTGLMHMDFQSTTGGTAIPGSWEVAVPNGSYTVTASVGDAGNFFGSTYQLSIEDQNAVAQVTLSDEDRFRQVTRTVHVADGRLTLSQLGGTNTKINYVDIASVPESARPRIASVDPSNLVSGVTVDRSVTAGLAVVSGGIDRATLTASTVRLTVAADGSSVASNVNTSGGGDVIVLTPDAPLVTGTTYRFDVTSGVKDVSGNAFHPWSSVFTVGSVNSGTGIAGVAFDKFATPATGSMFTSVTMGPDDRLYAATLDGYLFRYPVAADGSLGAGQRIDTVRTHAGGARTIIGLAFDPAATASNPVLWVTENRQYIGVADVPDWTGKIVRLSGADLERAEDVVVGLPRSARDHESNSLAFKDGLLYLTQGSNTAMGAPDSAWEMRPESTLSAAVLRLDPAKLPTTLPLDVKTADGGTYDPFAPGAPLTLYATGVRNAYDLVWHSNGQLYVPTNGSARGGNLPETPSTLPPSCQQRIDGPWTGPRAPGVTANPVDETDWVFKVRQGGYYGHPNPARCEWSFNGGNPTSAADLFEATAYPVGTLPDRNYQIDDVFDAGLHASANGTIEYASDVFGPALKGKLIVVRYSASQDLMVLDPSGTGGKITSRVLGVTGFKAFNQPLDVAQHVASGTIYVTELGGQRITRLVPRPG